ncbi:MAG: YbhB/YbcL family Raf kinase inhibitor-like protein [Polyangiaceae bacterium]|nr:YbhB/YbcL family Raf kinase inhibitor-like protein [Polyangiaceae bacterium]
MGFTLTSPKFQDHTEIPADYTHEGRDVSPPLDWRDVPAGTQSLALVCEDPDAPDPAHPQRTWVHWILYNIPPDTTSLPENAHIVPGSQAGTNDWHKLGYGGPAPPIGRHRYFFRLYALDTMLPDKPGLTRSDLSERMRGHVIGTAELIGTYEAKKKKAGRAA